MFINPFPISRGGDFDIEYQMSGMLEKMPAYDIDVTINDDDGELIADLPRYTTISRYSAAVRLTGAELLKAAGVPDDVEKFSGNVTFSPRHDTSHPGVLGQAAIMRLRDRESGYVADFNTGPGIMNVGEAAATTKLMVTPRTKIFSHVLDSDEWETSVFIVNQSSLRNYEKTSETKITVYSPDGPTDLVTTLRIPPYGSIWFKLSELFPNVRDVLRSSNGLGFVKARDLTLRQIGYYVIRNTKTGAIASDHLYGG